VLVERVMRRSVSVLWAFGLGVLLGCSSTAGGDGGVEALVEASMESGAEVPAEGGAEVSPDAPIDTPADGSAGLCCPAGFDGTFGHSGGWSATGECPPGYYDPGCDCDFEPDDHNCAVFRCRTPFFQCFPDAGDANGGGGGSGLDAL
jgi:hypothetical protein